MQVTVTPDDILWLQTQLSDFRWLQTWLTDFLWLQTRRQDFAVIKPGMTRWKVQQLFPMESGLQGRSPVRFLHPECLSCKVDVWFTGKAGQIQAPYLSRDARGRTIFTPFPPDDIVTRVSAPYVARPMFD
jgi:hypothetical protein